MLERCTRTSQCKTLRVALDMTRDQSDYRSTLPGSQIIRSLSPGCQSEVCGESDTI
jgi:hypothetical protein